MPSVRINRRTVERGALAATSGLLAGFTALAVGELVASLVRPQAGPVTVVGGAAIDRTPAGLKDYAIRTFGESDKLVLQLGILATIGVLAALLGLFALRHRRTGAAGVLAFGAVGAVAALTRPDSGGLGDVLPSLLGAVAGAAVLQLLVGHLTLAPAASGHGDGEDGPAVGPTGRNRRGFLIGAGVTAVWATRWSRRASAISVRTSTRSAWSCCSTTSSRARSGGKRARITPGHGSYPAAGS
ncbi:hypothetical protein [Streptomyces virginiae]|uniref:hypothetical protein n=1 Tax=Streptomyces virginiae TaxID=1961 RepID=UPI003AF356F8